MHNYPREEKTMKICFPIESDQGMDSKVSDHFGSAPQFLLVDTDSNEIKVISNSDQHHSPGACNPMQTLHDSRVEGVAVRSIGAGAVGHLTRSGLHVYKATGGTVRENVEKLAVNALPQYSPSEGCSGHGNGQGCCH
jgi:predicted Fe-Mo cluster-binding NifX family protein